jgi:hypothetical protein
MALINSTNLAEQAKGRINDPAPFCFIMPGAERADDYAAASFFGGKRP